MCVKVETRGGLWGIFPVHRDFVRPFPMPAARRPLLRHPEDARSLAFVALYGVLATTGWLFAPKSTPVLVAWVAVTAVSSGSSP